MKIIISILSLSLFTINLYSLDIKTEYLCSEAINNTDITFYRVNENDSIVMHIFFKNGINIRGVKLTVKENSLELNFKNKITIYNCHSLNYNKKMIY